MEFNLPKYLTENKLTHQSFVREEDDVLDVSPDIQDQPTINLDEPDTNIDEPEVDLGEPQDTMSDTDVVLGEPEQDIEEPTDDWNKAEPEPADDFEKEPSSKDIQEPKDLSKLHKSQSDLKKLTDYKDQLVLQYKSGQIGLDQYKELIGNIPQHIKKLRNQIDKAMTVTLDDEEDEI